MTMKLLEGYDHLSSQALASSKAWTFHQNASNNGSIAQSIVAGRITGNCSRLSNSGGGLNESEYTKPLPSALTHPILGAALRISALPSAGNVPEFFWLRVGATKTMRAAVNSAGHIVILNSGGTTIATGTGTITTNTWVYLEFNLIINGASGSIATQFNGAADIATTTGNFGSTGVDNFASLAQSSGFGVYTSDTDDIYVLDASASPNNTFLGDMHVYTLYPSADGNYSQWTPDSGSPHFSRVNEHASTYPDGDTSYVVDGTSGHRDSYAFDDLVPLTGTVFGVQSNLYARKDDVGLRQIVSSVRSGGTDYDSAVTQTLSTSYVDYTDIREVDPSTSAAWVISGVNAAEYGIKVV